MSNLNHKIMKELTEKECMEMNGGSIGSLIGQIIDLILDGVTPEYRLPF
ncbi:MAG: hypothetical protein PARBA_01526 [Parabacteroides sp.]